MARKSKTSAPPDDEPIDDLTVENDLEETTEDQPVDDVIAENPAEEIVDDAGSEVEEAPEVPPTPSWREQLGDEFASLSDDAAIERLRHRLSEAQQAQQQAQQYQYMLLQERQRQEQAAQQAQLAQAQQAQAKKREVPPFDPSWLQLVKHDEQGNLVAIPGAQPDIPQKIQAYARWKEQETNRLLQDPVGFYRETVMPTLVEEVRAMIQDQVSQYHATTAVNNWENQHAAILYTDNTRSRLTPIGAEIVNHANTLLRSGLTDKLTALNTAMIAAHHRVLLQQQQAATQQQTASQQNAAQKQKLLRSGAKRLPNRNGAVPNSETEPAAKRPPLDFGQLAKRELSRAGMSLEDSIS